MPSMRIWTLASKDRRTATSNAVQPVSQLRVALTAGPTRLGGQWYPALSSERHDAELILDGERFQLLIDGAKVREGASATLAINDRLGVMARRITFDDESMFETLDNTAVDEWLSRGAHVARKSLTIHRLERSWRVVVISVIATAGFVFAAFHWGLPSAASTISDRLPIAAHESVGEGTLATLDKFVLDDSEIDEERQAEIRARFERLVAVVPDHGFTFKLHFRHLGVPNAFALPGGDVIITDGLIELAKTPEEIDSVLLHEIGHVVERHGMQQTIQASTIAVVASLAIGDVGALGDITAALPAFLLQSSYSRDAESEADEFAFAGMAASGMDPAHFADIILKLTASAELRDEQTDDEEVRSDESPDTRIAGGDEDDSRLSQNEQSTGEEATAEASGHDDADEYSDWWSSHPDSRRRAKRAREVSDAIERGTYELPDGFLPAR